MNGNICFCMNFTFYSNLVENINCGCQFILEEIYFRNLFFQIFKSEDIHDYYGSKNETMLLFFSSLEN